MDSVSPPSPLCRLIRREPSRWLLGLLFCAALVTRGRVMIAAHDALYLDPDGYASVADELAETGRFAPRFGYLTARRPPLYPVLLALAARVGLDVPQAAAVLHALCGAVSIGGVWYLGRQWRLPPGACLAAAGLVAIDPILLASSTLVMTETLAAALAVAALVALTRSAGQHSPAMALVAGAVMGLCVLCRGEFLAWTVLAAGALVWLGGPRRAVRLIAYTAALAVALAPWTVRNWRLSGQPVVTTTHGGFTLLLANNPQYYEHLRSAPWGAAWDGKPLYDQWPTTGLNLDPSDTHGLPKVFLTPLGPPYGQNELDVDRQAYRQALENIRAEPGMFAWSCLARVGRLWNVLPHQTTAAESAARRGARYAVGAFYAAEFVLAAVGAWFLRRKLFAAPYVWATLLVLSVTLVHVFYWSDMRMRAPLEGVVALAAACGASVLACRKAAASALSEDA